VLPLSLQVLLDLGLSISSSYPEDKGVDLLLLLQDMTQQQQQQQQHAAAAAAGSGNEGSVQQQGGAGLPTVRHQCAGRCTHAHCQKTQHIAP
jgi:tRNA A-37 threonylcarbamoyl transferase component Bud32